MAVPDEVRVLRDPRTIRQRCENVLSAALREECAHFEVDLARIDAAADRVADVTRRRYPNLRVPPHSRFAHFDADGVARLAGLRERLSGLAPEEQARRLAELVIVSVLVDAGAGPSWAFEDVDGARTGRSEGLAIASLRWAERGELSREGEPYRIDTERLATLDARDLEHAFQVRDDNPLLGVAGRVSLLRALAGAVQAAPEVFVAGRLGGLVDGLLARAEGGRLPAAHVLDAVLAGLSSIWPGRLQLAGEPLGDVWPHPAAGGEGPSRGLVPLHKLSQWLSFSLLHPLEVAGLSVVELDALTGLAEYRNGGLLIDTGVLRLRDPGAADVAHAADSELVVEWRALTVALLERLLPPVRTRLGLDASAFPLPLLLEGGTWAAGRELARSLRTDGSPPLRIRSDGTVF